MTGALIVVAVCVVVAAVLLGIRDHGPRDREEME